MLQSYAAANAAATGTAVSAVSEPSTGTTRFWIVSKLRPVQPPQQRVPRGCHEWDDCNTWAASGKRGGEATGDCPP